MNGPGRAGLECEVYKGRNQGPGVPLQHAILCIIIDIRRRRYVSVRRHVAYDQVNKDTVVFDSTKTARYVS